MQKDELIKHIIDENRILELITLLGCTHIKDYKNKFQCARPKGDNPTGMIIWKDNLKVRIFTPHKGSGDIFTLVMATYDCDFVESIKKIHELLNIPYRRGRYKKKDDKIDPLENFKKIKRTRKHADYDYDNQELYIENQLGCFLNMPHISWVREGILPSIMKEFNIGYDFKFSRITIPWRGIDITDDRFVGCVGRTTIPNYEMLDIPKYWAYNNFLKSNYLYGYAENYEDIINNNLVVIVESEKSVLKTASRKIRNFLATGGHNVSHNQRKLLISLGVEICVSWDSDIDLFHVLETCELFYKFTEVSFTYDELGFLGKKESVGDLSRKDIEFMVDTRVKYTNEWHKKYLKMKREREESNG